MQSFSKMLKDSMGSRANNNEIYFQALPTSHEGNHVLTLEEFESMQQQPAQNITFNDANKFISSKNRDTSPH